MKKPSKYYTCYVHVIVTTPKQKIEHKRKETRHILTRVVLSTYTLILVAPKLVILMDLLVVMIGCQS